MSAGNISLRRDDRLHTRRRRARTHLGVLLGILALVIAGSLLWLTWQPWARISSVTVYGADQSLADYVSVSLAGTYVGIIPHDFAFLYPGQKIRSAILSSNPQIAAVAIFRTGLTGLAVEVSERVPVARWCGFPEASSTPIAPLPVTTCYLFDASGYVYATATEAFPADASSTNADGTLNPFALFSPLTASSSGTLGATIANAVALPATFDFARQVGAFGSPVEAVVINPDGEVDDYLSSGTYLMYVLGQEEQAYGALASGASDLDLKDGSLEYVDLRFPGKVYFKASGGG